MDLRCSRCEATKPCTAFNRNGASRTGYHNWCSECRKHERTDRLDKYREYQREWQAQNRDKMKGYNRDQYKRFRAIIDTAKDVPCALCGDYYPGEPYLMDFHHRDPATKSFSIGRGPGKNVAAIRAEIAKCDVLCAICHRRGHAAQEEVRPVADAVGTIVHQVT